MTKEIYKKFWIFLILVFLQIFSFSPTTEAAVRDEIFVSTTGYSILSPNTYIFAGFYGNNNEKKGFTTYFQFQKRGSVNRSGPDFTNLPFEETIKIVRNNPEDTYGHFYTSPELQMFSTYYFRSVGYFNDKPEEKIYGYYMTLTTGYLPNGSLFVSGSAPVYINRNYVVDGLTTFSRGGTGSGAGEINFIKPCTNEDLEDGCVVTRSLICREGWKPIEGVCTSLAEMERQRFEACMLEVQNEVICGRDVATSCESPKVFSNGACIDPDAGGGSNPPPNPDVGDGSQFDPILGGVGETPQEDGLVKCGRKGGNPCGFDDIINLINDIIKFILVNLAIPISAIMFAYAGFQLATSGGSTEKKDEAKRIFTNVAIGLILVAGAFLIVQAILMIVGLNPESGIQWFGLLD